VQLVLVECSFYVSIWVSDVVTSKWEKKKTKLGGLQQQLLVWWFRTFVDLILGYSELNCMIPIFFFSSIPYSVTVGMGGATTLLPWLSNSNVSCGGEALYCSISSTIQKKEDGEAVVRCDCSTYAYSHSKCRLDSLFHPTCWWIQYPVYLRLLHSGYLCRWL